MSYNQQFGAQDPKHSVDAWRKWKREQTKKELPKEICKICKKEYNSWNIKEKICYSCSKTRIDNIILNKFMN